MPSVSRSGALAVADASMPRGVVLEPGQAARRVEPEAAQEARTRRPWRRRSGPAGCRPRAPARRRRRRGRGRWRRTRPRRRTRRRTPPTPACATPPCAQRTLATGAYQRSHAARRSRLNQSPVLVTRTSLAGGAVVPSTKRCRARRVLAITDSSTRRSTAGRHVDTQNAGQGEQHQQHERRVDRPEQERRDRQTEQPSERREQRHEHVVEGEHLVTQHRQPVEVLRALVMLDGRHRRLQVGDVRFERDRDPVAEPALDPLRQQRQVPRRRHRDGQTDAGDDHHASR